MIKLRIVLYFVYSAIIVVLFTVVLMNEFTAFFNFNFQLYSINSGAGDCAPGSLLFTNNY
jgi:hypothetical protein